MDHHPCWILVPKNIKSEYQDENTTQITYSSLIMQNTPNLQKFLIKIMCMCVFSIEKNGKTNVMCVCSVRAGYERVGFGVKEKL